MYINLYKHNKINKLQQVQNTMMRTSNKLQARKISNRILRILVLQVLFLGFFQSAGALSPETGKPVQATTVKQVKSTKTKTVSSSNVKPVQSTENKLLEQGNNAYKQMKYAVAVQYFEAYIKEKGTTDRDVLVKLSDCYWQMREYNRAGKLLDQLVKVDSINISIPNKIRISDMYARLGNYKQAAVWLDGIPKYASRIKGYKDTVSMKSLKEDSIDWKISFLNLNTNFREFSPVLAGNNMLFSSNSPATSRERAIGWDGKTYARLWTVPLSSLSEKDLAVSDKDSAENAGKISFKTLATVYEGSDTKPITQKSNSNGKVMYIGVDSLEKSHLLGGLKKFKYNVATASLDGNNTLYFSANQEMEDANNRNRIGIMQGQYSAEGITNIQPTTWGKDVSKYSVMHPAVNKLGTMLVFSSDKPGGKGGFDLYFTERKSASATWGAPKMFTDTVNTVGNEVFPYISQDGYLYFSSDGHAGLGGLDIYRVLLSDAVKGVGEVELMGYPVNSSSDDFGFAQESKELETGYFTTDRISGNDNIYRFKYDPKPKLCHISGIVKEKKTLQPMQGATVFLYNKTTDEVIIDKADSTGRYTFDVRNIGDFTIKAVETNCKDDCLSMKIDAKKTKNITFPASRDLLLELTFKNVWVLDNLLYDYDKWDIRTDAQAPLDSLVKILQKFPISIELGSHTDSRGTVKYNNRLSQRRAESAVAYVQNKGIDVSRITAKGYGETRLKNRCSDGVNCTEEEHQMNRRTEITVTYNPAPANSIDPNPYTKGQKLSPKDFPENFFKDCK